MLDIIAGLETPDNGTLSIRRGVRTSYLKQYPLLNESNSIIDELSPKILRLLHLKLRVPARALAKAAKLTNR